MELEQIGKELQAFNVTDSAIAQMAQNYGALVIKGIDDKPGYVAVHRARMDVKTRRVSVQKKGKELREDAVRFQRAVIAEEKRIIDLLQPIEDHLQDEESRVDQEKARIRLEAEAIAAAKLKARKDRLFALGCNYNEIAFTYGTLYAPLALIKECTEEQFEKFCGAIQEAIDQENAIKAEAERARQEEADRLARIAAEQELARKRLEEELRKLHEEKEAIEREKREAAEKELRAQQAAKREEELRIAREEAAEKARIAEQDRVRREAEEAARKEEARKEKERRKEARRPDRDKLAAWIAEIAVLVNTRPEMRTEDGQKAMTEIVNLMDQAVMDANSRVATL